MNNYSESFREAHHVIQSIMAKVYANIHIRKIDDSLPSHNLNYILSLNMLIAKSISIIHDNGSDSINNSICSIEPV